MCEILIQVTCPHCEGTKVNKNGKKGNGNQNFYGFGTLMTLIVVKFWHFISENAMIELVRLCSKN